MIRFDFCKELGIIQRTSLLARVVQIFIRPRPSLCLADLRLFVQTQLNNPPWSVTLLPCSRAQLTSQRLYCTFCVLGIEHYPHTRRNSRYDSDIKCKNLGTIWNTNKFLYIQDHLHVQPMWDYLFEPNSTEIPSFMQFNNH